MRSLELLEVAASAEALRLRRGMAGMARRSTMMAAAALFGLVTLALLQVALWLELAARYGSSAATLWLAGLNGTMMAMLLLSARSRRDAVAAEALMLRRQAIRELGTVSPLAETLGLLRPRNAVSEVAGLLLDVVLRRFSRH